MVEGPFLDFLDPWGNRLEIIEYSNIQFTKAPNVMRGMGLALDKNDKRQEGTGRERAWRRNERSEHRAQMQLSLIVRGQHPPGDIAGHLRDDLELVRRAEAVGFDGIVKGSHYSAHPFEYVQQIPFLGLCRRRSRRGCG